MSRDSGAGAYVQSAGTMSVKGEVVRALVDAGLLLAQLHQDVVQQGRRAEAVEIGRQPVGAERLVHEDEMLDRLLRLPDAAGRLEPDLPARLVVDVAHRLEHAERHGQGGRRVDLAGARLDEV